MPRESSGGSRRLYSRRSVKTLRCRYPRIEQGCWCGAAGTEARSVPVGWRPGFRVSTKARRCAATSASASFPLPLPLHLPPLCVNVAQGTRDATERGRSPEDREVPVIESRFSAGSLLVAQLTLTWASVPARSSARKGAPLSGNQVSPRQPASRSSPTTFTREILIVIAETSETGRIVITRMNYVRVRPSLWIRYVEDASGSQGLEKVGMQERPVDKWAPSHSSGKVKWNTKYAGSGFGDVSRICRKFLDDPFAYNLSEESCPWKRFSPFARLAVRRCPLVHGRDDARKLDTC